MWPAEPPSELDAARLQTALSGSLLGRQIIVLQETTSTNDIVYKLAGNGAPEGLVVFAERQTTGRGQYGRSWESPRGLGLWFSMLLRPELPLRQSPRLTSWLARTVAQTISDQLRLAASVKHPNDVVIEGRKVAGVLVEMRSDNAGYLAVAGLGINILQREDDFPPQFRPVATSLALATGRNVDRTEFAVALLRDLNLSYAALRPRPAASVPANRGKAAARSPKV